MHNQLVKKLRQCVPRRVIMLLGRIIVQDLPTPRLNPIACAIPKLVLSTPTFDEP